jgi:hypothetical protein
MAKNPTNRIGVTTSSNNLSGINNNDWAMYAGVEFGGSTDYSKTPVELGIIASSASSGGIVEVWLDSIDTGVKVSECNIDSTGAWDNYQVFTSKMEPVSGRHDVYLKFTGEEAQELFRVRLFKFLTEGDSITSLKDQAYLLTPQDYELAQNYPNPFNPLTKINFFLPNAGNVELTLYNQLGEKVSIIARGEYSAGSHGIEFVAENLASGIYYYKLKAGSFSRIKKMILMK